MAVTAGSRSLARRLGLFDATMIVMGGIIGSGIFMNPAVVARDVGAPRLILAAWAAGGLIALAGAFVYAELGARRPGVGGQYAYLREAYHPMLAFVYGWGLLLVIQSGGMAAGAVTFARYFLELTHAPLPDWAVAALVLAALTTINCLGVRAGGTTQDAFMALKILAILALVTLGFVAVRPSDAAALPAVPSSSGLGAFGAAMVPVLFAYGGWQTASFVAGEMREPRRDLPRGLILGVLAVVALYLAVNLVCLRALGAPGLARAAAPASEVMRRAIGPAGGGLVAGAIAISTLGFLSPSMLTAPRVYFAMAQDGSFFRGVARLEPRTQAPVVAIVLQGAMATAIAISGRYERILNYVVSVDWIFFALTAGCVFALRRRDRGAPAGFAIPGHPVTTLAFLGVGAWVVVNTIRRSPADSLLGLGILLAGVPAYLIWRRRAAITPAPPPSPPG